MSVDVLSERDAVELFTGVVGPRARQEPAAARFTRMPDAVRVAAPARRRARSGSYECDGAAALKFPHHETIGIGGGKPLVAHRNSACFVRSAGVTADN